MNLTKQTEDADKGVDDGVNRDYRITWNSTVLSAFKTDAAALSSIIEWAGAFVPGLDLSTLGGGFGNSTVVVGTSATATTTKSGGNSTVSDESNEKLSSMDENFPHIETVTYLFLSHGGNKVQWPSVSMH
ncbi:hypothetical protein HK100_009882, partial [Physocladia obscura]